MREHRELELMNRFRDGNTSCAGAHTTNNECLPLCPHCAARCAQAVDLPPLPFASFALAEGAAAAAAAYVGGAALSSSSSFPCCCCCDSPSAGFWKMSMCMGVKMPSMPPSITDTAGGGQEGGRQQISSQDRRINARLGKQTWHPGVDLKKPCSGEKLHTPASTPPTVSLRHRLSTDLA